MSVLKGQRGFILMEVLVALTLLSLMMAATVAALRTLATTRDSVQAVTDRVDELRLVSRFIRNALESALPAGSQGLLSLGGAVETNGVFNGDQHSVRWSAPLVMGQGAGGLYDVQLSHENRQLLLRWRNPVRGYGQDPSWSSAPQRVLLHGVDEFQLQYRTALGEPWIDQCDDQCKPLALSLQIKTGGRYWPQMIVSLPQ